MLSRSRASQRCPPPTPRRCGSGRPHPPEPTVEPDTQPCSCFLAQGGQTPAPALLSQPALRAGLTNRSMQEPFSGLRPRRSGPIPVGLQPDPRWAPHPECCFCAGGGGERSREPPHCPLLTLLPAASPSPGHPQHHGLGARLPPAQKPSRAPPRPRISRLLSAPPPSRVLQPRWWPASSQWSWGGGMSHPTDSVPRTGPVFLHTCSVVLAWCAHSRCSAAAGGLDFHSRLLIDGFRPTCHPTRLPGWRSPPLAHWGRDG